MNNIILIGVVGTLFLSACAPTWKSAGYEKVDANNYRFGSIDDAESYLIEKIAVNQAQQSLGLFASADLLDGSHGYRHKNGHYHFGKSLAYKQERQGNAGKRTYFMWVFDSQVGTAKFFDYAELRVHYPYKNSTDESAENTTLKIFEEPRIRAEQLKVDESGLTLNGIAYIKSNNLVGMTGYHRKATDFDQIARSSYDVRSNIQAMESNMPSLSQFLTDANSEVSRREKVREAERIRLAQIRAKIRMNSSDSDGDSSSGDKASKSSKGRLALSAVYGSKHNSSASFLSESNRDAHDNEYGQLLNRKDLLDNRIAHAREEREEQGKSDREKIRRLKLLKSQAIAAATPKGGVKNESGKNSWDDAVRAIAASHNASIKAAEDAFTSNQKDLHNDIMEMQSQSNEASREMLRLGKKYSAR